MGTDGSAEDRIVDAIVRQTASSPGFPALSANLSRVLAISGQPNASAQELAQIILQDYGLTSKTLKVVNAAYYGLGKNKVSTISRAIVLLGFNTIKDIAAGMLVFEHFFKRSGRKAEMLDVVTRSFLSAIQAGELSVLAGYPQPEEAFICSLLHKLGKMVVAVYCPREYQAICRLLAEGRSEYEAGKEALGVSLARVGRAVAEHWKLSQTICESMDGANGGQKEGGPAFLRTVSSLSNKCVERLCCGEPAEWQDVLGPLQKLVALNEESFLGLMKRSAQTASSISPLMIKSLDRMGFKSRMNELKDPTSTEEEEIEDEAPETDEDGLPAGGRPTGDAKILMELMADISHTLTTECSLNQIYPMIVETLYRGLGFERVVLAVPTTDRKWLLGRYGLGADIDRFISEFQFAYGGRGILNEALRANGDLIIDFEQIEDADFRQRFAPYLADTTLVIYPVVVRQKPIGCLFAHTAPPRPVSAEEQQTLCILRNYGVLAIERHSHP